MKRTALLIAMTAFPAISFAASLNTITFKGEVSDQTCQVTVNGNSGSPIVVLPTVPASALTTAGETAGKTPFTIAVTGCTVPASDLNIKTTFLGANVNVGGNLGNTGTAQNVAIQLLDGTGGNPITLSGMTSVPGLVLSTGATSASHDFAAQYIATGAATAGTVSASAQYALDYL